MQTTMTDNKFNIVWNKINNTACEILEPTKQDEEKLKEQLLSFPPEFIEKIRSCLPGSLEKIFCSFQRKLLSAEKKTAGAFCLFRRLNCF